MCVCVYVSSVFILSQLVVVGIIVGIVVAVTCGVRRRRVYPERATVVHSTSVSAIRRVTIINQRVTVIWRATSNFVSVVYVAVVHRTVAVMQQAITTGT
jgi:hypothetical protein